MRSEQKLSMDERLLLLKNGKLNFKQSISKQSISKSNYIKYIRSKKYEWNGIIHLLYNNRYLCNKKSYANKNKITNDINKVTCKNCLRLYENQKGNKWE